ncbi:MAG: CRTAC1 family protein [Phycisphaerae bacterium]
MILAVVATGVVIASALKFVRTQSSDRASTPPGKNGTTATGQSGTATSDSSKPSAKKPYFKNRTEELGIDFVHDCGAEGNFFIPEEMGAGGAWLDYDDDGDLDLYLVQGGSLQTGAKTKRDRLFRNDAGNAFVDVTADAKINISQYGMGAYAADFDNDGDTDLYVTNVGPNALLINQGDGTFVEGAQEAGIDESGFSTGAAFFDFDRDGWLDLYVTNYLEWSPQIELPCYSASGVRDYCNPVDYKSPAEDRLYRNRGDGTFEDVSATAGMRGVFGHGLGVLAEDFNQDGYLDLYIANDQNPAFLWVNQGNGTFKDEATWAGCAFNSDGIAIAGMGVVSEDLDGDADFDLVVTNIHDQAHLALQNNTGSDGTCQFEDQSRKWGFGGWGVPYTGFGIALFDRDADGKFEGIVTNGAVNLQLESHRKDAPYAEPNQYIERNENGRFIDAANVSGFPEGPAEMSRGVLVADFDNDGDVDFVITNNRGSVELWENDNQGSNNWIILDVRGRNGRRYADNALVEVTANGRTWRRRVRPHVGYLTSNDPRIHFGLGKNEEAETVTAHYTDGTKATWNNVKANRHWQLVEGQQPKEINASR